MEEKRKSEKKGNSEGKLERKRICSRTGTEKEIGKGRVSEGMER